MPTADLKKQFLSARRAGTPLMAINTPDPAAIEQFLLITVTETPSEVGVPFVRWDCGRGFTPLNAPATEQIERVQPDDPIKMPEDALGATVELCL